MNHLNSTADHKHGESYSMEEVKELLEQNKLHVKRKNKFDTQEELFKHFKDNRKLFIH